MTTSTNPYTTQSISGYNATPPADDGSQVASNQVEWAKHKTKIGDPIKTLSESINSAMVTAGAKLVNTDTNERNSIAGSLAFAWATATLATDAIVPLSSAIRVGTEGNATRDTLQNLSATGVYDGALVVLAARSASREILIVHATSTAATATAPNIFLTGDSSFVLDDMEKRIFLMYEATTASGWVEVSRSEAVKQPIISYFTFASSTQSTVVIPLDDTIPNDSEGFQFLSAAWDAVSANSKYSVEVAINIGQNTSNHSIAALFATATTALMAVAHIQGIACVQLNLAYHATTTATTTKTFKVRAGSVSAGTYWLNADGAGARLFGGTMISSIKITEFPQ